LHQELP
jgi:hypothetical protein